MKSIDRTVRRETVYIAIWVAIFSVIMQAVFLIIGLWDYTVLLGNLLGGILAVLNFFLMGITVQNAVQKQEEDAKSTMRFSQSLRSFMLLIGAVAGVVLSCFNTVAVIIPLFFPRIAIIFRPLLDKKKGTEVESE